MEFISENDFPTYSEMVDVARHMFALALHDVSPSFAQVTVEQFRAAIRDHLLAIDCDPNDPEQLKAAAVGALIAVHTQMSYSQIGNVTAMLPASIINMIVEPISEETTKDWEGIARIFQPLEEKKPSLLRSLVNRIFGE